MEKEIKDPLLADFARTVVEWITYKNRRLGVRYLLDLLPKHAPPRVRVSWLLKASNINTLVAAMLAKDYAPNHVKNSLSGAISEILQAAYDEGTARQILNVIPFPNVALP